MKKKAIKKDLRVIRKRVSLLMYQNLAVKLQTVEV
jgi:hypothetical protein